MNSFLPIEKNFLGLSEEFSHPDTSKVIILPVPYEATSTYGKGSALGPQAILDASHQVEFFDSVLGFEIFKKAGGIATLAPLNVAGLSGEQLFHKLSETVSSWLARKKFVMTLGGEHSSIVGAIHASSQLYPDMTVLQFDAHSDLRLEYEGSEWNHACAMARVLDFHPHLVQVGIRSQSPEDLELLKKYNLSVFYAHEINQFNTENTKWMDSIIEATLQKVYITFDSDVLDPSIMPSTGTPEPGGLTWNQINALLKKICKKREIVGFDVNELAPIPGLSHPQFTMAKLIHRLIGFSLHYF